MPELPEVETVRLQLEEQILDKKIESVSKSRLNLRKPFSCSSSKVKNKKIKSLKRWGKRLFIELNTGEYFDVSLGMTGSFRFEDTKSYKKQKHDHVTWTFSNQKKLIYNDARRFGWVEFNTEPVDLSGWDPLLSSKKDFQWVVDKAKTKDVDSYTFLMDQKYIVGLGNIYVQEILFRSGVSPFRKIHQCSAKDFESIRKHTGVILKNALKNGGSTILNYKNAAGESGAFQTKLRVYGKKKGEPCLVCKEPISHIQKGRAICYCSNCQI